jgi:hypothetical protein
MLSSNCIEAALPTKQFLAIPVAMTTKQSSSLTNPMISVKSMKRWSDVFKKDESLMSNKGGGVICHVLPQQLALQILTQSAWRCECRRYPEVESW